MPSLDGLRGVAILIVIAHNVQLLEMVGMDKLAYATFMAYNVGWVGVQLFFVLSGFLITGILLDTLHQPHWLRNFMARRALRIFPLYYATLLLIFVILPALDLQPDAYKAQAPHQIWLWTYLVNWTDPLGYGPRQLPHLWSLAVEEQFYLLWPLAVLAARTPARVAWMSLGVVLVALACRAGMVAHGVDKEFIYSATISRMDALAMGAIAAAWWRMPTCRAWFSRHARALAMAAMVATVALGLWTKGYPRTTPTTQIWGYGALSVVFAVMVALAAWRDAGGQQGGVPGPDSLWQRCMKWQPLRVIGKYSYGMYIIHKPLHDLGSAPALKAMGLVTQGAIAWASLHLAAIVLISLAAAWLSYHLFEVHFLKLKRHFE